MPNQDTVTEQQRKIANISTFFALATNEAVRESSPCVPWKENTTQILRNGEIVRIITPLGLWKEDGRWWSGNRRDIIWCGDLSDLIPDWALLTNSLETMAAAQ